MKAIRKKLHSRRGESLTEVLISVLIAALASTLLAGMVSASVRMIQSSSAALQDYYTGTWTKSEANLTMEYETGKNVTETVATETIPLGRGEKTVVSYQIKGGS